MKNCVDPTGPAIWEAMKRAGVRLCDLAQTTGISYRSLQNYVSGKNRARATNLLLVCSVLGIDPKKLQDGEPVSISRDCPLRRVRHPIEHKQPARSARPVWDAATGLPIFGRAALRIFFDADLGRLSVEHDGRIGWDDLQRIKNHWFGADVCAIEVYPPHNAVVNNACMRHLWRLGPGDWWPDLSRESGAEPLTLRERYEREAARGA